MVIEVLNTGSELLLGQVANTHAAYFGRRLADLGLRVARATTVPDGPAIRDALAECAARASLVLVTGGLGPTSDDITRDAAADLLGLPLEFSAEIFAAIEERFRQRGVPVSELIRREAMVPRGATVLPNACGTAPGLAMTTTAGTKIFLLPGPPRELVPMFEASVLPAIAASIPESERVRCRILRTVGIGESTVQERVEPVLRETAPSVEIGYCARPGEVDVRLTAPGSQDDLDKAASTVKTMLAHTVYSESGESLEEVVVRLALEQSLTLATAESCTGGALAHRLTLVPGASGAFLGGAVTYANSEKIRQLDVPLTLLDNYGAVSEEVAAAMAAGIRLKTGASITAATTGIAGPGGGSELKPVGLCFIAVDAGRGTPAVRRYQFRGDRETFKYQACQQALDLLRRALLNL